MQSRLLKPLAGLLTALAVSATSVAAGAATATTTGGTPPTATTTTASTTPSSSPSAGAGAITDATFQSSALNGTVHYAVYLPRSYGTSNRRYPVIYFLHGLPASDTTYRSIGWIVNAVEQSGHEAIVIGAQGSRGNDVDPEWLNLGAGRNWEDATATELVSAVDSRYQTIRGRTGRAIIGVSAGGYGAAAIGLHHPETFSVIQSWSGYFRPTDPSGMSVLYLGSKQANDRANVFGLARRLRGTLGAYYWRTHIGFYVGTDDQRFRPDNERLERVLTGNRVPHVAFGLYRGAHTQSVWNKHAGPWIALALSILAPAR
jgi:enterochelin esterase-like enzyme